MNRCYCSVALAIALPLALCATAGPTSGCQNKGGHGKSTYVDIAATELPPAVRTGFDKAYPGASITKAEKETYADGTVHYEIEFRRPDGKKGEAQFDTAGELLPEH